MHPSPAALAGYSRSELTSYQDDLFKLMKTIKTDKSKANVQRRIDLIDSIMDDLNADELPDIERPGFKFFTHNFHMTFENGWTVSVTVDPGSSCSQSLGHNPNAEATRWHGDMSEMERPRGYQEPEDVAAFIAETAALDENYVMKCSLCAAEDRHEGKYCHTCVEDIRTA